VDSDLDRLYAFFRDLPGEIQNFMRYNLHDHAFLRRRLGQIDGVDHWRVIAEMDGQIVGDGTLDREQYAWTRHVAELRCVVDPRYQHVGISTILCRELVALGAAAGIERLCTELTPEQTATMEAVKKAGFVHEVTRAQYAKGQDGRLHDVLVFSNDLGAVWKALADHMQALDEPHYRSGEY
jgi:RimJ/RimL family protein N-acetyltransferase